MTQPRQKNLAVLALGGSVATPKDGIIAQVLVYVVCHHTCATAG
jgi:hypothetical protein